MDEYEIDLDEFDRRLSGDPLLARGPKPQPALPVGTRVQVIRKRSLGGSKLITVRVGDLGTIVRVSPRAYAIDMGGVLAVVWHADVIEVPAET